MRSYFTSIALKKYMIKFPNYRQLDGKDCGPTCVQIISKYYGKFRSLQEIRELSSISKEGLSLYELGLTAEKPKPTVSELSIDAMSA